MASIELSEFVHITHLMSYLFCISLITVISTMWMDSSSGSAPLLMMYANMLQILLAFLCSLICHCRLPCFPLCCNKCCFLSLSFHAFFFHSRTIYCLQTMGVAVSSLSIIFLSILPYIFFSSLLRYTHVGFIDLSFYLYF